MNRTELVELLRRSKLAVVATVHDGAPQAATVGVAIGEHLEIIFDTQTSTRKFRNIGKEPRVAIAMGEGELGIQIEGTADVPGGEDLANVQAIYFATYPEGRDRMAWPDIAWVRVRPHWLRVSDYRESPPVIEEHQL